MSGKGLRNKPGSIINDIHKDNTRLVCGCDNYCVQVMHFDPNIITDFKREKEEVGEVSQVVVEELVQLVI